MKAHLPTNALDLFIASGADAVADELAEEAS